MVDATKNYELPFPDGMDSVAVHSDIERLAKQIDQAVYHDVRHTIQDHGANDENVALHIRQSGSQSRRAVVESVFTTSTNFFDRTKITPDMVFPAGSGVPQSSSNSDISDWIPVEGGASYTYGTDRSTYLTRLTYFNADREYVGHQTGLGYQAYTHDTPQDAVWVRLSVPKVNVESLQMNAGSDLLPYEPGYTPYIPADKLEIPGTGLDPRIALSTNLFNPETVTPDAIIPVGTGELTHSNNFDVSAPILVKPETEYTYTRINRITYFNADHEYLGHNSLGAEPPYTYTTPHDTAYIRISVGKRQHDEAQVNEGPALLPYEPYAVSVAGVPVNPRTQVNAIDQGSGVFLTDTDGLGEIYTAPTLDAFPDLDATQTADVYDWYDDLMAAHPDYVTREEIGMASDGINPMYAYTLKAPTVPLDTWETPTPVALLISGVHGYEKAGVYNVWRLAKALCDEWQNNPVLDAIRWNIEVVIIPVGSPYGYDASTNTTVRTNANGVDIERNFAAGWIEREPGTPTYGGSSPMSEPETVAIDEVMASVADRAVMGASMHNFSASADDPHWMIWASASNTFTLNLGKQALSRMSRKWKQDHSWITDTSDYFGFANAVRWGGGGKEQMLFHGIQGSTFEVSRNQRLGGNPDRHTSEALTLGYEATVNYVAMAIKAGIELKNRETS